MDDNQAQDVTELLQAWRKGDSRALDRLLPRVYDELRRLARAHLRGERPGHTLQATALVHEAYARLVRYNVAPRDRTHFFALSARLMRQILVDHARRRKALRRGRSDSLVALDDSIQGPASTTVDLLALDEALSELHARDPRLCRVVELKYFAGLETKEMAHALQVSPATIERDWTVARAWLLQRLS